MSRDSLIAPITWGDSLELWRYWLDLCRGVVYIVGIGSACGFGPCGGVRRLDKGFIVASYLDINAMALHPHGAIVAVDSNCEGCGGSIG
jgi:hypothetical protein